MARCDAPDCIAPATVTTYRNDGATSTPWHWCARHDPRRPAAGERAGLIRPLSSYP